MDLSDDPLFQKVEKDRKWFEQEAKKHRKLNRSLWSVSSGVSVLIALGTNFDISIFAVTSAQISAGLAIVLPAVTAYTVLRSPEQLWLMETNARNQLAHLKSRIEFAHEDDPNFDRQPFRDTYLRVKEEAGKAWMEIKKSQ